MKAIFTGLGLLSVISFSLPAFAEVENDFQLEAKELDEKEPTKRFELNLFKSDETKGVVFKKEVRIEENESGVLLGRKMRSSEYCSLMRVQSLENSHEEIVIPSKTKVTVDSIRRFFDENCSEKECKGRFTTYQISFKERKDVNVICVSDTPKGEKRSYLTTVGTNLFLNKIQFSERKK